MGKMASEISHNYPLMEIMGYTRMDKRTQDLHHEEESLLLELVGGGGKTSDGRDRTPLGNSRITD